MNAPATAVDTPAWSVDSREPFLIQERTPPGFERASLSRYGEDRWVLDPLQREHRGNVSLVWRGFRAATRESWRRAGWMLVNMPTPVQLLDHAQAGRLPWLSADSMYKVVHHWRQFDKYLGGRQITTLREVDAEVLEDYAGFLAASGRSDADADLLALSRLWGFSPHLPAADRIPMPPWEVTTIRDYLPLPSHGNENSTSPIHPAVMSPLLIWALRFTEEFSEDIIAAWQERKRLMANVRGEANPVARGPLRAMLERYAAQDLALPATRHGSGEFGLALNYIAGKYETSPHQVKGLIRKWFPQLTVGTSAPLSTAVRGLVDGRPWKAYIDFAEAGPLMRLLSTAGLIVTAYLSGLRPAEVLRLEVGCCPGPPLGGSAVVRYQLFGNFFKGARGKDGKLLPEGARREIPWTTIPPVAHAIKVLERTTTTDVLFSAREEWLPTGRGRGDRTGRFTTAETAGDRITAFVAWVNGYVHEHGLDVAQAIPADPDGSLSLSRYRRTVAWHIARLPGGRIALAIQYGHLHAAQSDAYGALSRDGIRRVLDVESAMSIAQFLHEVAQRLEGGEGVSGPAAKRMIKAARERVARYEGMYLSEKDLKRLLVDPEFQVFDHPDAFLTCNKDPDKALCDPFRGKRRTGAPRPPALDRCDPACANIARTDTHIYNARAEIQRLHTESADPLTPGPLAERQRARVRELVDMIERHEATRVTADRGQGKARRVGQP